MGPIPSKFRKIVTSNRLLRPEYVFRLEFFLCLFSRAVAALVFRRFSLSSSPCAPLAAQSSRPSCLAFALFSTNLSFCFAAAPYLLVVRALVVRCRHSRTSDTAFSRPKAPSFHVRARLLAVLVQGSFFLRCCRAANHLGGGGGRRGGGGATRGPIPSKSPEVFNRRSRAEYNLSLEISSPFLVFLLLFLP